ncbi:MAG: hypothetical protein Q9218_003429 [Villophora microphyllina]
MSKTSAPYNDPNLSASDVTVLDNQPSDTTIHVAEPELTDGRVPEHDGSTHDEHDNDEHDDGEHDDDEHDDDGHDDDEHDDDGHDDDGHDNDEHEDDPPYDYLYGARYRNSRLHLLCHRLERSVIPFPTRVSLVGCLRQWQQRCLIGIEPLLWDQEELEKWEEILDAQIEFLGDFIELLVKRWELIEKTAMEFPMHGRGETGGIVADAQEAVGGHDEKTGSIKDDGLGINQL